MLAQKNHLYSISTVLISLSFLRVVQLAFESSKKRANGKSFAIFFAIFLFLH